MVADELEALLPQVVSAAREASPLVMSVEATPYTDSTGDAAVRFEVTLADPPGGAVNYLDVEPVKATIYRLTADLDVVVYVGFHLVSEQREIEAGTYYG